MRQIFRKGLLQNMNGMNSIWNGGSNKNGKSCGSQIFILICTAFPIWLPLVLFCGYQLARWINGTDFAPLYERSWGIELSSEWEESCRKKSDTGFQGDGVWYSVYENVSESSIAGMHIPFIKGKNESIIEEFQFVAESAGIGDEDQPDFTKEFIWAKLSEEYGDYLIFLFFPEEERLFLAQAFF